jgi:hypothetical protein
MTKGTPATDITALQDENKVFSIMAMDKEMDALQRNHTWDDVERFTDSDQLVNDCKWVYEIKLNAEGSIERFKGRVVGKAFTQLPGHEFDETFTPVVRYDSHRYLLTIAAHHGWLPQQMNVKSAFLYGVLKAEIYMELPEGYRKASNVARLQKCIYGLKQSACEWYGCLSTSLSKKKHLSQPIWTPAFSFTPSRKSSSRCMLTISSYLDHKHRLLTRQNTSFRTPLNAKISAP